MNTLRWPIGAIHEHKTKYTITKPNTRTQNQIHEHKTKYTNTKPNARTQNQIHQHKTKYTNTKPNTPTQNQIHQHNTLYTNTKPNTPTNPSKNSFKKRIYYNQLLYQEYFLYSAEILGLEEPQDWRAALAMFKRLLEVA